MTIACRHEREVARLRPVGPQRLAGKVSPEVSVEHRALAHREDARLGSGRLAMAATSPAAKTKGCDGDCRPSFTAANPRPSHARPLCPTHGTAAAPVAQTKRSAGTRSPDAHWISPAVSRTTRRWSMSVMRRLASARATSTLAREEWPDSKPFVTMAIAGSCRGSSRRHLRRMASATSAPPAPPPTTASRRRPAGRRSHRTSMSRHASRSPETGLTGTACSAAPGTDRRSGVESHVQGEGVEPVRLPVCAAHATAGKIDALDARHGERRAGAIAERPQVDMAVFPGIVPREKARQHAAVRRVGIRADEQDPDPGWPVQRESPQHLHVSVAAAGEDQRLHARPPSPRRTAAACP